MIAELVEVYCLRNRKKIKSDTKFKIEIDRRAFIYRNSLLQILTPNIND